MQNHSHQSDDDVPAAMERLAQLGAATVHEALGRIGAMDPAIRPLDPGASLAGPAVTVDAAPGDNLAVHRAAAEAPPGSVLVIDAKGFVDAGLWGDVLSLYAQHRGIAGLVVDGSVRDTRDIVAMGFPVFSRGVCIKGTDKFNPGRINVPVSCGGVIVEPGDVIVGDADGVTVVPRPDIRRAIDSGAARMDKEDRVRGAIRSGQSLIDLLGLRATLERFDALPPSMAEPLEPRY